MTVSLNKQLREGDPLAREPEISADHVERIRLTVMASRAETIPATLFSRPAFLVTAAALAALVVALAGSLARRAPERAPAATAVSEPRQIQFETPGGTRIVWVLNPDATF